MLRINTGDGDVYSDWNIRSRDGRKMKVESLAREFGTEIVSLLLYIVGHIDVTQACQKRRSRRTTICWLLYRNVSPLKNLCTTTVILTRREGRLGYHIQLFALGDEPSNLNMNLLCRQLESLKIERQKQHVR
jgi:hypothetical protein